MSLIDVVLEFFTPLLLRSVPILLPPLGRPTREFYREVPDLQSSARWLVNGARCVCVCGDEQEGTVADLVGFLRGGYSTFFFV